MNAASVARMIKLARTTCVVYRRAPGADDGYYAVTSGDYAPVGSPVDCAVAIVAATNATGERLTTERLTIANYYVVYLPWSVVVTEDDELRIFVTRGEDATIGNLAIKALDVQAPFYRAARCEVVR